MSCYDFKYKVAIIGNPDFPDTRYDDSQLTALKNLGFNAVQLNIAWGTRPGDEPLNLEDILTCDGMTPDEKITKRFNDMKFRAKRCKEFGFRTIFHFGAPKLDKLYDLINYPELYDQETFKNSIQKKEIVLKYENLLSELAEKIPEIDDIFVYTFDQDASVANEFGNDPLSQGIPLHQRLSLFINSLCDKWKSLRPQGMMWWEPWELSAGQIYAIINRLPKENFGLALHSNIAEVQAANPVDRWFRNMVSLCRARNIPIIGELFLSTSTEELSTLQNFAAPGLVYHQISIMRELKVDGIKEYFGLLPDKNDINLKMAGVLFEKTDIELVEAFDILAEPFCEGKRDIIKAWEQAALGMELFPWDTTWLLRQILSFWRSFHGWNAFSLDGKIADTPSWKSSRRSVFILTENESMHPWLIEDFALRCKAASDELVLAVSYYKTALISIPEDLKSVIEQWLHDTSFLNTVFTDYFLHAQETLVVYNIRRISKKDYKTNLNDLFEKLRDLLFQDTLNQKEFIMPMSYNESATEKLIEFDKNPEEWVKKNLI